ncbi:MAG TPA: isochorismatase family cysteine hydrolase [Pyrinomonadaceae bacterium]|nr:isochorismatase family cysteine hydrolase [Pyrinomonadaceae bacterium]
MPGNRHSNGSDLHGNVPDRAEVALLLIDVINDLEFEGGQELLRHALPMAQRIADLKSRLRASGVPIIYVNDNFGKWRSDFNQIVRHCLEDDVRGEPVAQLLAPDKDDYFVLKPKHSGFFSTTLNLLLRYLGVHSLILTGIAGNNCVLFTANDAYLRDFRIFVPSDCVASIRAADNEHALRQMQQVLKAEIRASTELELTDLVEGSNGANKQQKTTAEGRDTGKAARAANGS